MLRAGRPIFDGPTAGLAADRIAQARAELEKANARLMLGLRHVLTPEQWEKLNSGHFGGHQVLADKSRVIRTIAVRVALASLGSAFYRNDEAAIGAAQATLKEVRTSGYRTQVVKWQ